MYVYKIDHFFSWVTLSIANMKAKDAAKYNVQLQNLKIAIDSNNFFWSVEFFNITERKSSKRRNIGRGDQLALK